MENNLYDEGKNIITELNKLVKLGNINFGSIEKYKNFQNIFHIGKYYYFIFNFVSFEFDYIGGELQEILGYKNDEVSPKVILSRVHPDDLDIFKKYEEKFFEFILAQDENKIDNYKIVYDIRFIDTKGKVKRILHQAMIIEFDKNHKLYRSLNVHTDITDLKQHHSHNFKIIDAKNNIVYEIDDLLPEIKNINPDFTSREREILQLILDGFKSKEIAAELFISINTVNNHRKNILAKAKCSTVNELIIKTKMEGWMNN